MMKMEENKNLRHSKSMGKLTNKQSLKKTSNSHNDENKKKEFEEMHNNGK